jgi:hypothetical protein
MVTNITIDFLVILMSKVTNAPVVTQVMCSLVAKANVPEAVCCLDISCLKFG